MDGKKTTTRSHWRPRFVLCAALGLSAAIFSITPLGSYADRLGIDFLLAARHIISPSQHDAESPVVIVAIDEKTHRTAPFADTPEVAWTPYLAALLDRIADHDPAVIGVDVVFPKTLDTPELLKGFDKPLLRAFHRLGRDQKLVLGEVKLSTNAISPYPGQIMAAGGANNLALLDFLVDRDNVVRQYAPTFETTEGGRVPSFGANIAARLGATPPKEPFNINFPSGVNTVPTFGIGDLFSCPDDAFFDQFKGKIVLIGEILDIEDRHVSAQRLTTGARQWGITDSCASGVIETRLGPNRSSSPGVAIHAAAIDTILNDRPLELMPSAVKIILVAGFAAAAAMGLLLLAAPVGLAAAAAWIVFAILLAVVCFSYGLVLPVITMVSATAIAFPLVHTFRLVVEDRERRFIRHAFQHYLSPTIVDQIAQDPDQLKLGGEVRPLVVMFVDLANFTTLSETLHDQPEVLGRLMNDYLTMVSDAVERHGGYVDKFIGDGVMALFGAPIAQPDAADRAVAAALECVAETQSLNETVAAYLTVADPLSLRVGIAAGDAVVGNMGSQRRFNYTAMGDIVNLAARLEGANKIYGLLLLMSETVKTQLQIDLPLRLIDLVAVKGKDEAVRVYEATSDKQATADRFKAFEAALALYHGRCFDEAAAAFEAIEKDGPSRLYAQRARNAVTAPPPADWDGRHTLTEK